MIHEPALSLRNARGAARCVRLHPFTRAPADDPSIREPSVSQETKDRALVLHPGRAEAFPRTGVGVQSYLRCCVGLCKGQRCDGVVWVGDGRSARWAAH